MEFELIGLQSALLPMRATELLECCQLTEAEAKVDTE